MVHEITVIISDTVIKAMPVSNVDILSVVESEYTGPSTEQIIVEEPWTDASESYLRGCLEAALNAQSMHQKAGYRLKRLYRIFTAVVILWSAVIFVVNGSIGCSADDIDHTISLVVNAFGVLINALFASLNLGYTYREHFEYEAKFFDLAQDIECILVQSKEFRVPADAFLTEIRERRKKLALAPELPVGIVNNRRR